MLDPHRLTIFRSVVATGSINRAAALLGYTPSAVSQQIAALQRETGLNLVERVGRGLEITASGRVLAQASDIVLEQLGTLDGTVADLRAGRAGRLTIAAFSTAGTHWLPPVVAQVMREFPETAVRLRIEEQVTGVDATRPDIAVMVSFANDAHEPGYHAHHLLTEDYVVVVPIEHPLAGQTSVRMAELAQHRWVDNDVSRGACRQAVIDAAAAAGFVPQFAIETTDYHSAVRFVAHGIGITVVPRLGAVDLPAGVVAVDLTDPTPQRIILGQVRDTVAENIVVKRALALLAQTIAKTAASVAA